MIPQHVVSSRPVPAPFLAPDNVDPPDLLTDYELGGADIRDPSQGLRVQTWTFGYDGTNVWAEGETVERTNLFAAERVTELSGAFDQNMNPAIGFVANGDVKLWWFDTVTSQQIFTTFDGVRSPKVSLDDKRPLETLAGTNDVIFCYLRGQTLCAREQRDRYLIEYSLAQIPDNYTFRRMGMNSVNRLQWAFDPPEEESP